MKAFIKPVDLWDCATVAAIMSGDLVLQVGQWVKCGGGKLSRYVSHNPVSGVVDCTHYPDNGRKFILRTNINKVSRNTNLTTIEKRDSIRKLLAA